MIRSAKTRKRQSGAATIEMTLVGIPILFVLVCIFEISRGMWMYHTLAYAAKEGTRFAIVHGQNCVNNPPSVLNSCTKNISDVATVIQTAGAGLPLPTTTLTFYAPAGSSAQTCTLSGTTSCFGSPYTSTVYPYTNANSVGYSIQITITSTFNSALAMLWPGWKAVNFTTATLGASSTDEIQF